MVGISISTKICAHVAGVIRVASSSNPVYKLYSSRDEESALSSTVATGTRICGNEVVFQCLSGRM